MSDLGLKSVLFELKKQCQDAKEASDKYHSSSLYEPYLIKILFYIKAHKPYKMEFVNFFQDSIENPGSIFWEIIMYCMRDLKWDEVKSTVLKKMDQEIDPRQRSILHSILGVYEENWEDSDLWVFYTSYN